jgi:hypothetical protein
VYRVRTLARTISFALFECFVYLKFVLGEKPPTLKFKLAYLGEKKPDSYIMVGS